MLVSQEISKNIILAFSETNQNLVFGFGNKHSIQRIKHINKIRIIYLIWTNIIASNSQFSYMKVIWVITQLRPKKKKLNIKSP